MQVTPDHMHHCVSELHLPTNRVQPRPGPMSVLLHRLHQLAWQWHHSSVFLDQTGFPIDILHCPIQELRQRTGHAWQSRVQSVLSGRKTMQGLQWASPALTMKHWHKHDPQDKAILRTCLNGTFFTADRPVSHTQEDDPKCKFCGQEDSQIHRHWTCPYFHELRNLPPEQLSALLEFPPSVTAHGWMPEPPSLYRFRQQCTLVPDTHKTFQWPTWIPHTLDCFTDGSCRTPTCPEGRLAAWGVVLGMPDCTFWPLANGVVPGWIQTAIRGEIWAAISACTFSWWTSRPVRLWIDNHTVCKRIRSFPDSKALGPNQRDADLWNHLTLLVQAIGNDHIRVVHVHSHQDLQNLDDVAEEWISQGNHHADALADQAVDQYPALECLWKQLHTDLQHVELLRRTIHGILFKIGKKAILDSAQAPRPDKQYASRLPQHLLETQFQPALATDLPDKYQCDRTQAILDWVAGLTSQEASPQFMSWFQLNALYEYETGDKGVRHVLPSRQWIPGCKDTKHVNFVQRTRSICQVSCSIPWGS